MKDNLQKTFGQAIENTPIKENIPPKNRPQENGQMDLFAAGVELP